MPTEIRVDEYEPPINFFYDIPDGYVVKGYEDVPAVAVKVICPHWWRIPKFREARYSLVVEGTDEATALPEGTIWSPMIGLEMNLHTMQYYVHRKIQEALVRRTNGQPIFEGILKPSTLCVDVEIYCDLDKGGEEEWACMNAKCYLAPNGYTAALYLYDDNNSKHKFDVLTFKTQALSYEALKEQLVYAISRIPDRKILQFVRSASSVIQFPGAKSTPTGKKQKTGDKKQ